MAESGASDAPSLETATRTLEVRHGKACSDVAAALTKTELPRGTCMLVVRQHQIPPTPDFQMTREVSAVEAVTAEGRTSVITELPVYGTTLLPVVLAFARERAIVVDYVRDGRPLQRFDPELPLMYGPTQPLEAAIATLEGAGYDVTREDHGLVIDRTVRRAIVWAWLATVVLFPLAVIWWAIAAIGEWSALRSLLAQTYVPGVSHTHRLVITPSSLSVGTERFDRSHTLAIVRFGDVSEWWVWVGLVTRDKAFSFGDAGTSVRHAKKLEPEQIALADAIAHIWAGPTDAPYRG